MNETKCEICEIKGDCMSGVSPILFYDKYIFLCRSCYIELRKNINMIIERMKKSKHKINKEIYKIRPITDIAPHICEYIGYEENNVRCKICGRKPIVVG